MRILERIVFVDAPGPPRREKGKKIRVPAWQPWEMIQDCEWGVRQLGSGRVGVQRSSMILILC